MEHISILINIFVGVLIATMNTVISMGLHRRESENLKYREERERKEKEEKKKKLVEEENRKLTELAMVRALLYMNYEAARERGYYGLHDREVYHSLWLQYKNMGGNGIMDEIQKEIVQLPKYPPEESEA